MHEYLDLDLHNYITTNAKTLSQGRVDLGSNLFWYDYKVPVGGCALDVTLEISLICILLSASRGVHFDKRMLLKWSILKSTSEPKPQRKAYHLKDTTLLCDF